MTLYRVYDIENNANKRTELSEEQINNIEILIEDKTDSLDSVSVLYTTENDEEHFIQKFNDNHFTENLDEDKIENDLDYYTERLVQAEKVEDQNGTIRRNKNITAGILFLKYTTEKLILLKLESTEIVDRESFESRPELGTDREYYKIAIIEKDSLDRIHIVDRNKKIAKYWAESFLNLSRIRDSFTNTEDLINFLDIESILSKDIWQDETSHNRAKRRLEEILFDSYVFNKSDIFQDLVSHEEIGFSSEEITEEEVFNQNSINVLDDEFRINKDVVYRYRREKLYLSEEIVIDVKNFGAQKKSRRIKLDDNEGTITIAIDPNKLNDIKEKFKNV